MTYSNLLNISFDFNFFPIFVIVAVAWFVPVLMSVLKLSKVPSVIVEIVAGYFIAMFFHDKFSPESLNILDFLALSGFMFLMFQSGLEIDVDKIVDSFPRRKLSYSMFLKNPMLVGLAIFFITLILSYLLSYLLSFFININNVWYFSLILITSSVGVIVPVLKNRGEIGTHFGQMIILAAAIADILSILLFTFTAFILKNGLQAELILVLVLFVFFFLFYLAGSHVVKFGPFKKITFQLSHAASQIKMRGTMLIIMTFVVLAQLIDKEAMLLGAFLGGLLLSIFLHKERSLLLIKLDAMGYGFFIPIFFIMVGYHFDSSALKEFDSSFIWVLIFILFSLYFVKLVPSLLWKRLFGLNKAMSGGVIIASRLSLIIAASKIGLDLGAISEGINAVFILMAVITCFISPIIYNFMNHIKRFEGEKTIIIGGSSTGVLLARRLIMHGSKALIVENNRQRCKEIKAKGISAINEDGTNIDIYDKLKIKLNNYIVVLTENVETNLEICKKFRLKGHERIIAKSNKFNIEQILRRMEIEIVDTTRVLATTIENLILRPTTYHALVETFENFSVTEIEIINTAIDGTAVKEIPFHSDGSIMLIKRNSQMTIPHGDTIFRTGDTVVVLGTEIAIDDFKQKFRG